MVHAMACRGRAQISCTPRRSIYRFSVTRTVKSLTQRSSRYRTACACPSSSMFLCADAPLLRSSRRAALGLGVVSISYFQNAKTVAGSPCFNELYRMYTSNAMDSWVDVCLYPFPNVVSGDHWCTGCPLGPFLDYTYLVRLVANCVCSPQY